MTRSRHLDACCRPLLAAVVLALVAGCAQVMRPSLSVPVPASFSHAELDAVLKEHVDAEGRVDYGALQRRPERLERYYAQLAAASPDSHPGLFPDQPARLAYWINAHNAGLLKAVLGHYPISSVTEVPAPFPLGLFDGAGGFFRARRMVVGGREASLRDIAELIRKRFADPRAHFALSAASRGGPSLRAEAYAAERLEAQLDDQATRFFADPHHLRFDHDKRIVYLSSILGRYEDDFTGWYAKRFPDKEATLLSYIVLYVDEKRADALRWAQGTEGYRVELVEYDWRLNGR